MHAILLRVVVSYNDEPSYEGYGFVTISTLSRATKTTVNVADPSSGAYSGSEAVIVIAPVSFMSLFGIKAPSVKSIQSSPEVIVKLARSSRTKSLKDPSS